MTAEFWRAKTLGEMTEAEWESVCDGCARCCMVKLQDAGSDRVEYTAVVCDLLDDNACRCTRYPNRHDLVPDCVVLDSTTLRDFDWLPVTCAYRTLYEGRDLEWWHPLVSGSPETVHEAGISVRGKVLRESLVHSDDVESMVVRWIDQ